MLGNSHVWFWPGFRYLITLLLLAAGAPLQTLAHLFRNNLFRRDNSTYFCQILPLLSTAGTISMCFDSSEQERFDAFESIVLIPLSTRSMLFMISAHDSIAMYLAIEPQSLCFYVIAASKRKSEFSTEAGSKYLILGAFPSGILLFGYYYGKSVYQDVNLRSYFGSIRPPTISTFGFRLGRCLLLHFPKGTFIHFFLPCRPLQRKRRYKSRPGKEKGQWWAFGKVGPIGCLHSSKGTEEERTDVISRRAFGGAEWGGLRREKQNSIQPKKMQRYGYHGRSPSRKNNPSKELRVSGASAHPKYFFLVNYRDFPISPRNQTKLLKRFFPKKSRSDGPRSHLLKRTPPAVRLSFHYSVMQYWRNTKNKMHLDPVVVLNHFVAPGVSSPSTMRGAKRGVKHRIRSRIAFFVESSTRDKKCLAQAKKRQKIAGREKTTISLFPFSGVTFFFPGGGVGSTLKGREKLWSQLSQKCWNLMGKDKVIELIDKYRELGSTGELLKGMEMMIEIILRNRGIPYGYNSYLNEVKKMRSFLSERTKTETSIKSVKIQSVYQSASSIAQDISFQPRNKRRSFSSIFSNIVKDIPSWRTKGVEGIRLCCSGRSSGTEIARTECVKYGKTSCNVFNQKIDYAPAEVSTRYGISGVKVWISYREKKEGVLNLVKKVGIN